MFLFIFFSLRIHFTILNYVIVCWGLFEQVQGPWKLEALDPLEWELQAAVVVSGLAWYSQLGSSKKSVS